MASKRTQRLEIPDDLGGGWVEIKDALSYVDTQVLESAGISGRRDSGEIMVDGEAHALAKLRTYIAAWSLTDEDGKALPVSNDGFRELDPDIGGWLVSEAELHYAARRLTKRAAALSEQAAVVGAEQHAGTRPAE